MSPDLVIIIIASSLGNGYCMCGFLFITDERNFLYYSLYILTEKSLKHLCSIRAWVPVSFFLSLSSADSLEGETHLAHSPARASKTLSRRHPVPSAPPREGARCLHEKCKSCVKDFIGFLHKPGSISLFLSFTFLSSPPDHQVPVH